MAVRLDIVVHTSPVDQALLASITAQLNRVIQQQEVLMANQENLDRKSQELIDAQAAEAKRQQDQDAATSAQIVVLQQSITDLQSQLAAGSVDPSKAIANMQSVIDSLNAEQPTPPIV